MILSAAALCAVSAAAIARGADTVPSEFGPLGCRIMNYYQYQDAGWAHIHSVGLNYVFIAVPPPEKVEATRKLLADNGLHVVVMRGEANLTTPTGVEALATQLAVCQQMGVHYMFLSPKHPGATREEACQRLHRAGEIARKYGVTLVLETHPDLGTNAAVHRDSMQRINHPNVRVNLDTGNVTFYNHGLSAPVELEKIIDYVATVEIKDHNGQFQDWSFPPLGQGVVDIPAVLRVLKKHHFQGPITIEVEGVHGAKLSEAQIKKNMADSVRYLHSLGTFK
jgi:sugar phosphate isomerase/epimerase